MPRRSIGDYPDDWVMIAKRVKDKADWHCIRCGHPHDVKSGHVLTVHHLDLNPSNNRWWNLAALCQKCHLRIQAKVIMERVWMFEHSEWFKPYVAGYYAFQFGLPDDRETVIRHVEELISLGQGLTSCDIRFAIDEARINEHEMWRGPCSIDLREGMRARKAQDA